MVLYKAIRKITLTVLKPFERLITCILFHGNKVKYKDFNTSGHYCPIKVG